MLVIPCQLSPCSSRDYLLSSGIDRGCGIGRPLYIARSFKMTLYYDSRFERLRNKQEYSTGELSTPTQAADATGVTQEKLIGFADFKGQLAKPPFRRLLLKTSYASPFVSLLKRLDNLHLPQCHNRAKIILGVPDYVVEMALPSGDARSAGLSHLWGGRSSWSRS